MSTRTILGAKKRLREIYRRLTVVNRSKFDNIYHCCTQKTASQWFKSVFSDPIFYKYTGLGVCTHPEWREKLIGSCFDNSMPLLEVSAELYAGHEVSVPFPSHTVGASLYIGHKTYEKIPKPEKSRGFFILRDPRDIVVSWYFSTKYSHALSDSISKFRGDLNKLNLKEGMIYSIDRINEFGLFTGQRSWMAVSEKNHNVKVFRYRDFALNNKKFLKDLFDYLDIVMPQKRFDELFNRHKFQVYSKGREHGTVDHNSHYRKGQPGDWIEYFDKTIISHFTNVTGDLLEVLGYQ